MRLLVLEGLSEVSLSCLEALHRKSYPGMVVIHYDYDRPLNTLAPATDLPPALIMFGSPVDYLARLVRRGDWPGGEGDEHGVEIMSQTRRALTGIHAAILPLPRHASLSAGVREGILQEALPPYRGKIYPVGDDPSQGDLAAVHRAVTKSRP